MKTAAENSVKAKDKLKRNYTKKIYGSSLQVGFTGWHKLADTWEENIYVVVGRDHPEM